MSNLEPQAPRDSEVRTTFDPATSTVTEVRRTRVRPNNTAWWVAGSVAVIAIVAIAFMVVSSNNATPSDQQLAAATDQGQAAAMAQNAQAQAASAQAQAAGAMQSAQASTQNDADRAAAARASAEMAADRAAVNAAQSGRDAAATAPESSDTPAPAPQQ